MKLLYLSSITIPSRRANRLQTMKIAEAFFKLCHFKPYVGKKNVNDRKIFNYYEVFQP